MKIITLLLILISLTTFGQNVKVLDLTSNSYSSGTSYYVYIGSQMQVTDKWTFEGWLYVDSRGEDDYPVIMDRKTVFSWYLIDGTEQDTYCIRFVARNTNDAIIASLRCDGVDGSTIKAMSFGTWYHVAVSRDGTTARMFINGTMVHNSTDADFVLSTPEGNTVNYGARYWVDYERFLDGALDEMRYSDIARYTSNFTITKSTLPHATSGDNNTILLFNFDNSDLTNSTSANTYTALSHGTLNYKSWDGLPDVLPLPVELTSFSASIVGKGVILNWETATEVNNYGFEIERSSTPLGTNNPSQAETREWETIGFTEGHGNSNSPKDYSFVDNDPLNGNISYRLKQIDINGAFEYSDIVTIKINKNFTNKLQQNHPNPFNPSTVITYELGDKNFVTLKVYNTIGQEIATLVNKEQSAGTYEVQFNAEDLPSGVYFYSLTTDNFVSIKKMILIR